ncbi:hypothetical protein J6590_059681 [Homalodisca vitripennis]|nr:hypothetical protein J6590_059681 [Homalodisca vitripennis]
MAASRNTRRLEDGSIPPVEVSTHRSLYPAFSRGSLPVRGDCQRFYKCQLRGGRMHGTLYQCPHGNSFWDVPRRCEKSAKIPVCTRGGMKRLWRPTSAPWRRLSSVTDS